jgi:PHD/YefM family antitoxin component YafN of YafNO toxin-antitoxin module
MENKNVLNMLVPITRFNEGQANKIFDEVKKEGVKIVLKNNKPIGVIMTPEMYEFLLNRKIED